MHVVTTLVIITIGFPLPSNTRGLVSTTTARSRTHNGNPSSYGAKVASIEDPDTDIVPDLYLLNDTMSLLGGGSRIAGGDTTSSSSYPYAASLAFSGIHECGASLIHPRALLTAAHCIWNLKSDDFYSIRSVDLRIGSNKRSSGGYVRKAVRLVVPEQYEPESYFGDVALVQLDAPVNTRTVKMATSDPGSGQLTAIGWGFTKDGYLSDVLRKVKLPKVSSSICKKAHKQFSMPAVPEDHFCAGLGSDGADTCAGDSGGPLLTSRAVGITSFGPDGVLCGTKGENIGAYTSVSYWRGWIEDTLSLYNMRGWVGALHWGLHCIVGGVFDQVD